MIDNSTAAAAANIDSKEDKYTSPTVIAD